MHDSNPVEMIFTVILMILPSAAIFSFCEFGEMVNTQFDGFLGELCQCDWYAFPIDIQQVLVIVLTCTERPTIIRGFANTECTRVTFKKVNRLFALHQFQFHITFAALPFHSFFLSLRLPTSHFPILRHFIT